jgi:hypothetical protein
MSSDGLVEPTVGGSDFPGHPVLGNAPIHLSGPGVLEARARSSTSTPTVCDAQDWYESFGFECLDGRGQRRVHEHAPAARRSSAAMVRQPVHRHWPG